MLPFSYAGFVMTLPSGGYSLFPRAHGFIPAFPGAGGGGERWWLVGLLCVGTPRHTWGSEWGGMWL